MKKRKVVYHRRSDTFRVKYKWGLLWRYECRLLFDPIMGGWNIPLEFGSYDSAHSWIDGMEYKSK